MDEQERQNTSELRTLLDEGREAAIGETGGIAVAEVPPSPTVLATDRWTKRAGVRLAQAWREQLYEALGLDDLDTTTTEEDAKTLDAIEAQCDPNVAADAIETLLSSNPTLAERPEDQHRAKWWKQIIESPEAQGLRSRTMGNAAIAEIAAAEIAGQWSRYVAEHPAPEQGEGEDGNGEDNESAADSVARIRSTREALKSATEAADAAESVGQGLGLGEAGATDAAALARYTKRLRQSPNLAAIMRMAGRFIAKAARLQRERSNLPGMEITGVELSGDLTRALPLEVAMIAGAIPEYETLALVNLIEGRTLSYRRHMRTPKQMGPIVVSIDESGSMWGERIAAAKGLALAMASIARAQKRPFMLVAWSDGPVRVVKSEDGPEAIVEWLEDMQNGGTNLHGPLWQVTTDHWPTGTVGADADHIIITDAQVTAEQWLLDHYLTWAKCTSVKTYGIGIAIRSPGVLAEFCDGGVWCMPSLDLDNPAVDVILSIGPTA